jgi:hypothetical protein
MTEPAVEGAVKTSKPGVAVWAITVDAVASAKRHDLMNEERMMK